MANQNHSERAHARLSASGASRWMNCTPSAVMEENYPDRDSIFAQEGTIAHELAEIFLKLRLNSSALSVKEDRRLGNKFSGRMAALFPEEDQESLCKELDTHVRTYTDFVMEQYNALQAKYGNVIAETEVRVDLRDFIPQGFGTCDMVLIAGNKLVIIDLKYGKGVRVSAYQNKQLQLYALGALRYYEFLYDIEEVEMFIVQPRLDNIDSYKLTTAELLNFGSTVNLKAVMAFKGEGELVTGDWCQFCKARLHCKAAADEALEAARRLFEDPKLLTDDELIPIYGTAARAVKWFNALEAHVLALALSGKELKGYKLVEGIRRRTWSDQDEAMRILRELQYNESDFTKSSLGGLGDLEKLLGGRKEFDKQLGGCVTLPPGKPTLVPVTDKRPAIDRTAEAAKKFED